VNDFALCVNKGIFLWVKQVGFKKRERQVQAMEDRNRRREDVPLTAPNSGGNVWPRQHGPVFAGRRGAPAETASCWYCRYADFHLACEKSLEVGICCWPEYQML
jgi:hypothetical protein